MEIVKTVLIVLAVLVILYLLVSFFTGSSTSLTTIQPANEHQKILASTLPSNNNTSNYTYSMWMYVDDWNYRFGEKKVVLGRFDQDKNPSLYRSFKKIIIRSNIAII